MFRKLLDEGRAGDNMGVLLRGTKRDEVERGQVVAKRVHHAAHEVQGGGVHFEQRGGGSSHAVFPRVIGRSFIFARRNVTGGVASSGGCEM